MCRVEHLTQTGIRDETPDSVEDDTRFFTGHECSATQLPMSPLTTGGRTAGLGI